MQFACSMYWGGDIVFATDCDYSSYLNLGTICPYCGSAVHLRASSYRNISGKEVLFNAYFAHYKTGGADDCEARAVSAGGAVDREQIRISAKNQRLELFNDRLWVLIATDRNISARKIKQIKEDIGGDTVARTLKWIREAIAANIEEVNLWMKDQLVAIARKDPDYRKEIDALTGGLSKDVDEQENYFQQCNQKMHLEICGEALSFLATRSGGYCLERIVLASFMMGFNTDTLLPTDRNKSMVPLVIGSVLLGTRWGDILAKYSQKNLCDAPTPTASGML